MQQVGVDALERTGPANQLLHDFRVPGVYRNALKAEANPEEHGRPQRSLQASPRPDVEDDAVVPDAAHLGGLLRAAAAGKLEEEGLRLVPGDDHIAPVQAHLVEDDVFHLAYPRRGRRAHSHDDERGALPLLDFLLKVEGGGDEEVFLVRPGAGVSQA